MNSEMNITDILLRGIGGFLLLILSPILIPGLLFNWVIETLFYE